MKLFKQLMGTGLVCTLSMAALPSLDIAGVSFSGSQALAQAEEPAIKLPGCKKEPEKRRLKTVGQKFIKKMSPIDELISPPVDEKTGKPVGEPNYKEAWRQLQKVMNSCDECSKAELALVYQRAAIIQYNFDDPKKTIEYFKKVIDQAPDIHISQEAGITYQVAGLYSSEENYAEAIKWFDRWESLCPNTVSDSYFYIRGQTLYLMGNKAEALKLVQKSIDLRTAKGQLGDESWYRLKMAIYIDSEDYKNAEKTAETLVVNFPNNRIMMQLAQIYGMNGKQNRQMALMDGLNVAGIFDKESQYKNLSYLYLDSEAPYLAAKVLQKGIDKKQVDQSAKNLESLGMSLYQAQEIDKALGVMEQAAKKSDDGKLYGRLSGIYYNAEKYKQAVDAGEHALKKKGLKSEGEVYLFVGLSHMNLKNYDASIASFRKAIKDEKYGKTASDLLKYVTREKKREADLKKAALDS